VLPHSRLEKPRVRAVVLVPKLPPQFEVVNEDEEPQFEIVEDQPREIPRARPSALATTRAIGDVSISSGHRSLGATSTARFRDRHGLRRAQVVGEQP
jgi:hypothetical protein